MNTKTMQYPDSFIMMKRCLLLSRRNPDTFITSILLPFLMMVLFVALFGKLIHPENTTYVNYIIPGVLLQCFGQCASVTAVSVNRDITSGIINRFCTLPIKRISVLNGHVLESVLRNYLTAAVVLTAALFLGFSPSMDLTKWLLALILMTGVILAFSWLAVFIGVTANSPEGASSLFTLVIVLPYLSSGFVPLEAMPAPLAAFSRYQPMTPIIESMRSAFLGTSMDINNLILSLIWCGGLAAVFCFISLIFFKKRLCR
ncbi:MAG TPA: ABC transporter permease [Candidatus Blautia merdigallinarum]|uniref:Transport permease protein n=1 Tax=Candidatus Blautia merdigallinarum TaxID=2838495 RepID=A0A9D2SKX4_9FIRM|nr:ABC transporter permease [Candidatus Blautia merdigallinarum]